MFTEGEGTHCFPSFSQNIKAPILTKKTGKGKEWKHTPVLPGMVQCQIIRFTDPSGSVSGLATKPYTHKIITTSKAQKTNLEKKKKRVMKSNMGMILSPSFALLSKTTTSNTSRHCCCLRLISSKWAVSNFSEEFLLGRLLFKRTESWFSEL